MTPLYLKATVLAVSLAAVAGSAIAAAPADWSKVPGRTVTVLYPGVSPIEWINKGTEHSGARGLREGDSCAACHEKELADMGNKMVTGQKLEPHVIKGKAASIPVNVQAVHDGANLYMRFTWKQPAGGGEKMDADNQVKLAFMLAPDGMTIKSGKKDLDIANKGGCWGTCHEDSRTMPDAKETGGTALIEAKGEKKGDTWTVTFARKFAGGTGDIALAPGKTVNFGMAIHDDHTHGRFHHVSMGYSLGIDAKADITAAKQ